MWIVALYLLAGLISLSGIYLAYRHLADLPNQRPWLILAGALLLLAAAAFLLAWRGFNHTPDFPLDLVISLLFVAFTTLVSVGILKIGQRAQALLKLEVQAQAGYQELQNIIGLLPTPIAIKNVELTYQAANPAFETFLGRPQAEIIGRKAFDFFPRPQAAAFQSAEEQVLERGSFSVEEYELIGANGKRWFQITRTPIVDKKGEVTGLLISNQDISQRKQLEQEINEQKLLLNAVLEEREDILEKKRLELESLNSVMEFKRLLVTIASHFIGANPHQIDQGLNQALHLIGTQTGMDRCQLLLFDLGYNNLTLAYEWTSQNVQPILVNGARAPVSDPAWLNLGQMQVIHVPSLDSLPRESFELAEYLRTNNIKSLTAVPLISGRSAVGYFMLESVVDEISWDENYLELLKSAAGIFVHALEQKRSEESLQAEQESTRKHLETLQQYNLENTLLNELGDLLQVCRTVDEAYPVIARYTQQLIPVGSGGLYLARDTNDPVDRVAAWGDSPPTETELAINECWGLRRGRLHIVRDSKIDLNCAHLRPPLPRKYICIPLIAQGETIGLLHLRPVKGETASLAARLEDYVRVSQVIAEQIALALSNLSLRDKLRSQAIRDPLTGLFNRRYMEETLEREIRRAVRHTTPVSVIMFDIDFLKKVNDTYGHDAGDVVLQTLGTLMMKTFRGEDVPCRYGGDEFTIVLPEATVSEAFRRAEQFREAFKAIVFEHEGKQFGPLTLSLGITAYPDHGATVERLMQTADTAAYTAKEQGRDRVMIGGVTEE
ncbi:MAG: hypothetical protein B6D39_07345 [Anaerolineae bacterium UTCFX2]|jgi:diguanylate cyclase (GGDEF)-like protein/PAS domain S-box-containing protein|nr:MAG: hypothetical protein B6D39_07345 [Anaerolineae bacterium UTCFX2]